MKKIIYFDAYTTRFDILKKHWEKHSPKMANGSVGTSEPIIDVDLGGIFLELDWEEKKITKTLPIKCPGGIIKWRDFIVVPSMWNHEIYFYDKDLIFARSFTHPYLCDVHSISVTSRDTLLVSSTGIDSILEFDFEGNLIWTWFATRHGYTVDQFGKTRSLEIEGIDHRKKDYPTLTQTTHLNSVIEDPFSNRHVITTLFHQGEVVRIDKETGQTTSLLSGLLSPHGLRRIKDGFMVTSTRHGEALMLDDNFVITKRYNFDSTWLQDTCISDWGTILGIRSEKCDIAEIDLSTGKLINTFKYDENWRGYQIYFPNLL